MIQEIATFSTEKTSSIHTFTSIEVDFLHNRTPYFSGKRMSTNDKEALIRLLEDKKKWGFWPTVIVARASGYSVPQIKYLRTQHNLHVVHSAEALNDRVYRTRFKAHQTKRGKRQKEVYKKCPPRVSQKELDRRQKLFFKERKCIRCWVSRPYNSEFFRTCTRKSKKRSQYLYQGLVPICLACVIDKTKLKKKK